MEKKHIFLSLCINCGGGAQLQKFHQSMIVK